MNELECEHRLCNECKSVIDLIGGIKCPKCVNGREKKGKIGMNEAKRLFGQICEEDLEGKVREEMEGMKKEMGVKGEEIRREIEEEKAENERIIEGVREEKRKNEEKKEQIGCLMWEIWNDVKGREEMRGGILRMKRAMECAEKKLDVNVEMKVDGRFVNVERKGNENIKCVQFKEVKIDDVKTDGCLL